MANKYLDYFLDLLFPIVCLNCQTPGDFLCSNCYTKININQKFFCHECKISSKAGAFCSSCQTKSELNGLWISADYHNAIVAELIKKLKYSFNKNVAQILARIAIDFIDRNPEIKQSYLLRDSLLIPVPLHKKRKSFRGFNQSELLAKSIAENTGLELDTNNLHRIKNTGAQAKLNRKERLGNVRDAFVWSGNNLYKKNIILIDDVSSTGATLNNCAKVLKENGAGEVWGLVLAMN